MSRRGYTVYKAVCAACHSMRYLAYRCQIFLIHLDFENFPSGTLSMSPTLRTKPRLLLRRIRLDLVNLSNWLEILMYHHLFTQFLDGPAEDGEMFMRPGKLSDYFPRWVLIWKLCEL